MEILLKRLIGKELKAYVPKLEEIEKEVKDLVEGPASDRQLQGRLLSLAGTSSSLEFHVVKSEEYGGSVSIMTPGRSEPVLKISPGATDNSLIGINRSNNQLNYWNLPYEEIGDKQDLGKAVRRIILGEAQLKVYDLSRVVKAKEVEAEREEKPDFGFTKGKRK